MRVECVDCGGRSPETGRIYVLMGEQGWRPVRAEGPSRFDWRCPDCWSLFKDLSGGVAPSASYQAAILTPEEPAADSGPGDGEELAKSGERLSLGNRERTDLAARMLVTVFNALSKFESTPAVREIQKSAVECQSIVWRWRVTAPDRAQQLLVVERLFRLQAELAALNVPRCAAATRR